MRLSSVGIAIAAGLLMFVGSASFAPASRAGTGVAPYEDATYSDALWNDVSGGAWPDTFPADWAAPAMEEAATSAGAVPLIAQGVGVVGLSAVAFDLGWKIGRTIDTKWLHLSGSLDAPSVVAGVTQEFECPTGSSCNSQGTSLPGTSYHANDGEWVQVKWSSTWTDCFGNQRTYSAIVYPNPSALSVSYGSCATSLKSAFTNAWNAISSLQGPSVMTQLPDALCSNYLANYAPTSGFNGWAKYTGSGQCFGRYSSNAVLAQALVHSGLETYANQTVNRTTNITAPTESDTTLSAIRSSLTQSGIAAQNEVNAALDPLEWERPGPNGSPPGGFKITWQAANVDETYDQYLSRLQSLGWLGAASVTSLDAINGDPAFALAGVPCTSVQPGTTIGANDPVAFFENPTTSFSTTHGSDGGSCGGGYATPSSEQDCEFNDSIGSTPGQGTWAETASVWGSYALDSECAEAWQALVDLGILNADFTLTSSAISGAQNMDLAIRNPALQDELPKHGSSIEFWDKVYVDSVGGNLLETSEGHHFELHFYRDVVGNTYTGMDFKVVFSDWFH